MGKTPEERAERRQKRLSFMLNVTPETDIRYRGFLSYRTLRIIAWACLILSQIGLVVPALSTADPSLGVAFVPPERVYIVLKGLATSFFMMATFSVMISHLRRYRTLFILYGGMSAASIVLFFLLHDRYLIGFLTSKGMDPAQGAELAERFLKTAASDEFFTFNLFIDLFLCTLFTFFMFYRPKKLFTDGRRNVFRSFAFLPVLYEAASLTLKMLASTGRISLPVYVIPFLTTKPPLTFVAFACLVLFIKRREKVFLQNGKTPSDYRIYLKTNLNSLQFSLFASILFAVVAVLDLLLLALLPLLFKGCFTAAADPVRASLEAVSSWGFGYCGSLLILAPLMMLFSYSRTHKSNLPDLLIPVSGIAGLSIVYLESAYQIAVYGLTFFKGLFIS